MNSTLLQGPGDLLPVAQHDEGASPLPASSARTLIELKSQGGWEG